MNRGHKKKDDFATHTTRHIRVTLRDHLRPLRRRITFLTYRRINHQKRISQTESLPNEENNLFKFFDTFELLDEVVSTVASEAYPLPTSTLAWTLVHSSSLNVTVYDLTNVHWFLNRLPSGSATIELAFTSAFPVWPHEHTQPPSPSLSNMKSKEMD